MHKKGILMQLVSDWIDTKLAEIGTKLPTLVHTEPASFSCGYNVGYKQAILDFEKIIEDDSKWMF
jgi:hypothetical protein